MRKGFAARARSLAISAALIALACAKPPTSQETSPKEPSEPKGPPVVEERPAEADIALIELPPRESRPEVPNFDGATAWLNVTRPLSIADLKGRIVVVDFWTSCCINCLQTLPVLERLEQRFAKEPVLVVGIHSAKFDAEKGVDRLRDAVRAHGIEHPVAVDSEFAIWQSWDVHAWPTVFILDDAGRAVYADGGEPDEELLTSIIGSLLAEGRELGRLAKAPLKSLRPEPASGGPLRYPGKVLSLANGGLAVADTGHHRVVVFDATGSSTVIGSGRAGLVDGNASEAEFNWPQGMAELDGALFVADTGNHLVRKIDLSTRRVSTVAGKGGLGRQYVPREPIAARDLGLRSPWALLPWHGEVLVALAGSHQLALFNPKEGTMRLFAGTGKESIDDGDLVSASFSQPSDLATDGQEIFVLDSETSSVRAIDPKRGRVRTVIGHGLFVFGDVDGSRPKARLQHPIGMSYGGNALWVADSYNSKIKRIDPRAGVSKTVFGRGPGGELDEPAGIAWTPQGLVVADTNHHRLVRLPLEKNVKPSLEVVALGSLKSPSLDTQKVDIQQRDPKIDLGELALAPEQSAKLRVSFVLPKGTKINAEAPARVTWVESEGLTRLPAPVSTTGANMPKGFEVALDPEPSARQGRLGGVLELAVCDEANTVCVPIRRTLVARVRFERGASELAEVDLPLPNARAQ